MIVQESSFQATIQDEGRINTRVYGMAAGGTADRYAAAMANILVGNARNNAVLEIPFGKISLFFPQETLICCVGKNIHAQAMMQYAEHLTEEFPCQRPVVIKAGTILKMQHSSGMRAYLAVSGGIAVPPMMQSRSTDLKAALGGFEGRALRKGDMLPLGIPSPEERTATRLLWEFLKIPECERRTHFAANVVFPFAPGGKSKENAEVMHFTEGCEWNECDEATRNVMQETEFRVEPSSDRMGIRLKPTTPVYIKRSGNSELISRCVLPGTIQCTPDGTLILLLADAQTTGGYPVLGHICFVDIARAAQLLPHQTLFFEKITLQKAENLYLEQEKELQQLALRVQRMCRYGKKSGT
jgi:antagonist of KipI